MSNWIYAQSVPTAPWRGAMTLPRALDLVKMGDKALLRQNIAPRIDASARHVLQADAVRDHHLLVSNDAGDRLLIGYDSAAKTYFIDRRQSGLTGFNEKFAILASAPAKGEPAYIELLLDRGSVELIADDGLTVMTALVFPRMPFTRVELVANGS